MRSVDIHEAKTHLSKLIDRATTQGESFIIAKAGKPLVKVVPLDREDKPQRRIGFLEGQGTVAADIKSLGGDEIAALFEGDA